MTDPWALLNIECSRVPSTVLPSTSEPPEASPCVIRKCLGVSNCTPAFVYWTHWPVPFSWKQKNRISLEEKPMGTLEGSEWRVEAIVWEGSRAEGGRPDSRRSLRFRKWGLAGGGEGEHVRNQPCHPGLLSWWWLLSDFWISLSHVWVHWALVTSFSFLFSLLLNLSPHLCFSPHSLRKIYMKAFLVWQRRNSFSENVRHPTVKWY